MLSPLTDQPRRVLMTLDAVGGVWRYAMELGSALKAAGLELCFVGFGPEPSVVARGEAEAIGTLDWLPMPLDWTAGREDDLDAVPEALAALARAHAPDLVHLNLPSQAYGLDLDCPVVTVSHSCVVTWFHAVRGAGLPADWAWQARRNRGGFDHSDAVIAPSRSHAEALVSAYGPISNLRVVSNAVGGALPVAAKENFVFAAGRWWDDGKNGAILDRAAARADWPVQLAGPVHGPNGQHFMIEHAQALGELPNAAVRALMARAAILVSPSLYEPFGLAALEGARAGTALVLSDIATYRENWDGAALFANPHDPTAFAQAINRLAADRELRIEMGRRATVRAERFSLPAQASATLDVYRAALLNARAPATAAD